MAQYLYYIDISQYMGILKAINKEYSCQHDTYMP